MSGLILRNAEEAQIQKQALVENSARSLDYFNTQREPMAAMFDMKFRPIGFHPTAGHPLNLIEQINQTFSFLCALEASELLFQWHKDLEGLVVYPGAHAPRGTLDIEALNRPGYIGAELFAAVRPANNGKLKKDLEKLRDRSEENRYEFFICPTHPETKRQNDLEDYGVRVWSIWPFA
ncbi:MAG: hypothetical protein QNI90_06055 [Dinoroseobacter sp.]|nr:hypothetical protein [Dinoroseobacter sp.]